MNSLFHITKRLQIVLNSLEMLCDFLDFCAFYLESEKQAKYEESREIVEVEIKRKKIHSTYTHSHTTCIYVVGLITEAFSMNKRVTTTANRLADTYGIYYMFNLVECVQ